MRVPVFFFTLLLSVCVSRQVKCQYYVGSLPAVIEAVGADITFLCQHPTGSGTIVWLLNGSVWRELTNNDSTEGLIRGEGRGNNTEALVVKATSRFNRTTILCNYIILLENGTATESESQPTRLIVQGPLDHVINITIVPQSSNIELFWRPPFTLNLTLSEPDIVYCVDIFNNMTGEINHLFSNCSIFDTCFRFTEGTPNPWDLYQFLITPRSNVAGAENGSSSEVFGSYSFEKPQTLTKEKVNISVDIEDANSVSVVIFLGDDVDAISGPKTPQQYEVSLFTVSLGEYSSQAFECPMKSDDGYWCSGYTNLTLNNSLIQPNDLYTVDVVASNSGGSTMIVRDLKISTNYIQDIRATPGAMSTGQIDIKCTFLLNNSYVMGYMAIVFSENGDIHYLIEANRDYSESTISSLNDNNYTVLLYAINNSGLPSTQAAGFPQNVHLFTPLVDSYSKNGSILIKTNFSVMFSKRNDQCCCIRCMFHDESISACIIIYHDLGQLNRFGLVDLNVLKIDRPAHTHSTEDCIEIQSFGCRSYYVYIAVFAFNGMIFGEPWTTSYPTYSEGMYTTDPTKDASSTSKIILYVILPFISLALLLGTLFGLIILIRKAGCTFKLSNRSRVVEMNMYATTTSIVRNTDPDSVLYSDLCQLRGNEIETTLPEDGTKVVYSEIKQHEIGGNSSGSSQTATSNQQELSTSQNDNESEMKCLGMSIDTLVPYLLPIASKWKELGEALSLGEDHLDEIFTNNETDEACLLTMLEFYFMNTNFDHTWKEVERAVLIVNEGSSVIRESSEPEIESTFM